ncbi:MAG: hypothetical protein JWQ25_2397 [Daejeonella sp.]|nr:hypothetical protein [Daejeonella sp.]
MTDRTYKKHIKKCISDFNQLHYELLTYSYGLFLKSELKNIGDELFKGGDSHRIDPELLILSTDNIVRMLAELTLILREDTESLANLNKIELLDSKAVIQNIKDESEEFVKDQEDCISKRPQDYSYDELSSKCCINLQFMGIYMGGIISDIISKRADVKIELEESKKSCFNLLEALKPYADTNTNILSVMVYEVMLTGQKILNELSDRGKEEAGNYLNRLDA